MGHKVFPADQEQPGALLQISPVGPFPSLSTGSIILCSFSDSETLPEFDSLTEIFCSWHGPCKEKQHLRDLSAARPGLREIHSWLLLWLHTVAEVLDYFSGPGSQKWNRTNLCIIRA